MNVPETIISQGIINATDILHVLCTRQSHALGFKFKSKQGHFAPFCSEMILQGVIAHQSNGIYKLLVLHNCASVSSIMQTKVTFKNKSAGFTQA